MISGSQALTIKIPNSSALPIDFVILYVWEEVTRIWISNKFLDDTNTADPGAVL